MHLTGFPIYSKRGNAWILTKATEKFKNQLTFPNIRVRFTLIYIFKIYFIDLRERGKEGKGEGEEERET